MDTIKIRYHFDLDNHRREVFNLFLNSKSLELINDPDSEFPYWTNLNFHQCPHCPLNLNDTPNCPVAVSLLRVIDRFEHVTSYDQIFLEVITDERTISQHTTAQQGISSLLGLLFASSGCTYTNFMKPMARFHLPLATEEETIYRSTGMYLLAQYFLNSEGKDSEFVFDGLKEIYENLHILNTSIVNRIRRATTAEPSSNAVVLLDMLAHLVPLAIEDRLKGIRYLFDSYLSGSRIGQSSPRQAEKFMIGWHMSAGDR